MEIVVATAAPWYLSPEWWLVAAAFLTLVVVIVQTKATAKAAKAASDAASAANLSVDAAHRQATSMEAQTKHLIASERAWIDADIVRQEKSLLKDLKSPYRLSIRNLGKTPGQIQSYEFRIGPYLCEPFPESLKTSFTWNERTFVGSGESKLLGPEIGIDLDLVFDELISKDIFDRLAFSVTVNYVDIVGGTETHRTLIVYLYTPLINHIERLGQYNDYR